MSAIVDDGDEIIKVLITLHENFDLLDFAGPLEALSHSRQVITDPSTEAFDVTICGISEKVLSRQGALIASHIQFKEAYERLDEFDILIVPGGGSDAIVKDANYLKGGGALNEPIPLITAFAKLQESDPKRDRTLLSVCTGSLFLGAAGVLQGLAATTHPDYDVKFEEICQFASAYTNENRTDVMQDVRYVVNNARFDIGDPEDDEAPPNPFIQTREQYLLSKKERRKSNARRGSLSHKLSALPENVTTRASRRLGGLRVITAGGITSGIDAALYVVSAYVSVESAEEVARIMQYDWEKGVVVDSIDF
ncbi:hypothetical protein ABW19_dt0207488 [Dactylella cylindrospora]|nr:hypothetical protein ABW19_dt0207488 [Dactylella cylindrospora]